MISPQPLRFSSAFTLVELLITVAIIAMLAVVGTSIINPVQLLAQSRDANRVADLATLNGAVRFYQSDQLGTSGFSLGNASSVYVSLPDATLSGNATSTCTSLGLPALPAGYQYECSSPQSYRDVDGTGWIPVNFGATSVGSSIPILPVDPKNQSSTGLYYIYYTDGSQFVISAIPESQKEKAAFAQKPFIPNYPGVIANGTNVAISPLQSVSGLVGYWPLDEGTGSTAGDGSGNRNPAGWIGTPIGTSGYYSPGKVGTWAGTCGGANDYAFAPSTSVNSNSVSVSFWMNPTSAVGSTMIDLGGALVARIFYVPGSTSGLETTIGGIVWGATGYNPPLNTWTYVVLTSDGSNVAFYVNGVLSKSTVAAASGVLTSTMFCAANTSAYQEFTGLLDDVHIYNRALSMAEIQQLYNATK